MYGYYREKFHVNHLWELKIVLVLVLKIVKWGHKSVLSESGAMKKESLSFFLQHILCHTFPYSEFVSVQTLLNISSLNDWLQGIQ